MCIFHCWHYHSHDTDKLQDRKIGLEIVDTYDVQICCKCGKLRRLHVNHYTNNIS